MLVMYVQNMPYEICSKIILRFMGEVLWQSVRLSIHPADGRTYMQIPPVFYRTWGGGQCPAYTRGHHLQTAQQGKGTDDHVLPLGDWL